MNDVRKPEAGQGRRRVLAAAFWLGCLLLTAGAYRLLSGTCATSGVALIGVAFFFHLPMLIAILRPSSTWLGPMTTHFTTTERALCLSFDDGPDPSETPALLDLLEEREVRAVFFVVGEKVEQHPELIRRLEAGGHLVGNHSWSHPERSFWRLGSGSVRWEVEKASAAIAKVTGRKPRWFRPPVGHKPWALAPVLKDQALDLMGWTVRGFDGVRCDVGQVEARILAGTRPGAIVLLHEGRGTAVELTRRLLDAWSEDGYSCALPEDDAFVFRPGRR